MRIALVFCLFGLAACQNKESGSTALTLGRPEVSTTIMYDDLKFVGQTNWNVEIHDGVFTRDWLTLHVFAAEDAQPERELVREIRLVVPLNGAGARDGSSLHVQFEYSEPSGAVDLGMGKLVVSSRKDWQQPVLTPVVAPVAPDSEPVDDDSVADLPQNGVEFSDYVDREELVVVRGADLVLTRATVSGTILLYPDGSPLDSKFEAPKTSVLSISGKLAGLGCRSLKSISTQAETGVRVERPNDAWDPTCDVRFGP